MDFYNVRRCEETGRSAEEIYVHSVLTACTTTTTTYDYKTNRFFVGACLPVGFVDEHSLIIVSYG